MSRSVLPLLLVLLVWTGCQPERQTPSTPSAHSPDSLAATYATVRLDSSLRGLSDARKEMVSPLIAAAQTMDAIFWEQVYGNRDSLLQSIPDSARRRYATLNYGPWDRVRNDSPFVKGIGPRPPGANFYPTDASANALKQAAPSTTGLTAPRTMVRRLPDGSLTALPYHLFFGEQMTTAALHLRDAASLAPSEDVRRSLEQRAAALMNGDSTSAPQRPQTLPALHILIGSLPTGEDRLLGVKASASALVLHRNTEHTQQLDHTLRMLPSAWNQISAPDSLIPNAPSVSASAYDAVYVAGGLNAGPKRPVHVLPSGLSPGDTEPRLLLVPNVLRAQVTAILSPLAKTMLIPAQRALVTPEAFFDYTLLRHAAHTALSGAPMDSPPTAGANALGLSLAMSLSNEESSRSDSLEYAVTALAHLIHTARIDSTTAAGRAATVTFNGLRERGAITRNEETGLYTVNPSALARAVPTLTRAWMASQEALIERHGARSAPLRSALSQLDAAGVPKALAFEQGRSVLPDPSRSTPAQ